MPNMQATYNKGRGAGGKPVQGLRSYFQQRFFPVAHTFNDSPYANPFVLYHHQQAVGYQLSSTLLLRSGHLKSLAGY